VGRQIIFVAAITVAECGMGSNVPDRIHRARRENYVRAMLGVLPVIPYTEQTRTFHAKLWATCTGGKMIGYYDLPWRDRAGAGSALLPFQRTHFAALPGPDVVKGGPMLP